MSLPTSSHEIRISTISIDGRLDAMRAVDLRQEIDETIEQGVVRLIVDLSGADFVDSAGLAALAKGMKDCRGAGGDLRVVAAKNPDAARVFQLTRFDQVFRMADTAEDLVATW